MSFESDLETRYEAAVARRDAIQALWLEKKKPLMTHGSTGQLVEHPLVKMLREHDVLLTKLAAVLGQKHHGPQPSAVLKLGQPASAKLRRVS